MSIPIEISEEEILEIIKVGLEKLIKEKEITDAKALLIKNLIEKEKVKITFEKIGEPIRIERDL